MKPDLKKVAAFWALRRRRICSRESLENLPADTARRGSTKINLAVLSKLEELTWTPYGKQSLGDFARNHGVKVLSYELEPIARELKRRSMRDQPNNRRIENRVLMALHLESVKTRHREAALSKKLVLVGYSLQAELKPMCLDVQGILRRFDHWLDLCELGREYRPKHLADPFEILHDRSGDFGLSETQSKAERAIMHLSVLEGVAHPRLVKYDKVELAANVEHFAKQPYRVIIEAAYDLSLPPSIDSVRKLAEMFEKHDPIGIAVDRMGGQNLDYQYDTDTSASTIDKPYTTRGCLCFETYRQLRKFINATKDLEIDGCKLYVRQAPLPEKWFPGKAFRKERDVFDKDMTLDFKLSWYCIYGDLVDEFDDTLDD
ncbi:hypothetical protein F5Y13DRAFT_182349 [Hypoxylon sp. FL1857]|nr:hypothetical protein F5Y13DRAFT_182349 [Hypoxylon sp. FL1857]